MFEPRNSEEKIVIETKIDWFDGTIYDFLSNFHDSPIIHNGKTYATVEHFFQAHKTLNETAFEKVRTAPSPGAAKTLGNRVELRPDWEEVKDEIMFVGLFLKFTQHSHLADKLLSTYNRDLEEGNNWGDKYWGTVNGEGENMLGKLLMQIRFTLYLSMRQNLFEDKL